jgi:hypothetical protein
MTHDISAGQVLAHPVELALELGTRTRYGCVAHDPDTYIGRTPKYKILKKFFHKFLYLLLNRQLGILRE